MWWLNCTWFTLPRCRWKYAQRVSTRHMWDENAAVCALFWYTFSPLIVLAWRIVVRRQDVAGSWTEAGQDDSSQPYSWSFPGCIGGRALQLAHVKLVGMFVSFKQALHGTHDPGSLQQTQTVDEHMRQQEGCCASFHRILYPWYKRRPKRRLPCNAAR